MIARVAALRLHAVVIDIPYGPGEWVKSKEEAMLMAANLVSLNPFSPVSNTSLFYPLNLYISHTVTYLH